MTTLFDLLLQAAETCNPKLAEQLRKTGRDTVLFGREGCLDSLGLVSFIVAVEAELEDRCGVHLTLADEKAMSQKHSPFRTAGALADYVSRRLEEEGTVAPLA